MIYICIYTYIKLICHWANVTYLSIKFGIVIYSGRCEQCSEFKSIFDG